jgi:hypothetical protein
MCTHKRFLFLCKHSQYGSRVSICALARTHVEQGDDEPSCNVRASHALHTITIQRDCPRCKALNSKFVEVKNTIRDLRAALVVHRMLPSAPKFICAARERKLSHDSRMSQNLGTCKLLFDILNQITYLWFRYSELEATRGLNADSNEKQVTTMTRFIQANSQEVTFVLCHQSAGHCNQAASILARVTC